MGDLIILDDAKRYLRIEESAREDDRLAILITEVSTHCESYCRRSFLKATYTGEKYDGEGDEILFLNQYPIATVASVTPYENATALTVRGTDFEYVEDTGELRLLQTIFPVSFRQVLVTYDAGYDTVTNIPADLRLAVKLAVATRFREQQKSSYNVTRQSQESGGSTDYIEDIYPETTLAVWKLYRRKRVG